jgi:hypothetical protein
METNNGLLRKIMEGTSLPCGVLTYWEEIEGVVQINILTLSFKKQDLKESLNSMDRVSHKDGFMFFSHSEEGKKWIKENKKELGESFYYACAPGSNVGLYQCME